MRTTKHLVIRGPLMAAAVGVGALAVSACGSASTTSASRPTTPTTVAQQSIAPGSSTSAPSTASSSPSSSDATSSPAASTGTSSASARATAPTYPACSTSDLVISLGSVTGAAGTSGVPLVFRNNSLGNCTIGGYPGVDATVGSSQVPAARTSRGITIKELVLDPSQEASALVTASDIPSGSATSCPAIEGFLVTPPDSTRSAQVAGSLRDCGNLEVGPLVSGSEGT